MKNSTRYTVWFLPILSLLAPVLADAQTTKETVIVTQPGTKSVVVSTPTPTATTATPTSSTTTVTTPATTTVPSTTTTVATPVSTVPAATTTTVTTPEGAVVPAATTTTQETVVTTPATVVAAPATVQRQVIVTPVPAAKEVVVAPTGFVHCFTVSSGWFNNEWIPQHQICQYENSPQGVSWVEGYWACTQYKMNEGICTSWDWRPGHWAKTLVVY